MNRPPRPQFRGVSTYRDPSGRFSFRYPSDWKTYQLTEDRDGVMFSPADDDPQTYFAVWITDLGEHVVAEDLDNLREGIDAGLDQLPESSIGTSKDDVYGNLIKFERVHTFREGGAVRKRRTWILYVDHWRMVVTWQGESVEEYHYWLPMGNYAFATFDIPEALWFATDRDLAGLRNGT